MRETDREAPDASLVARTRRGDPAAFDALVRRHYRAAFAVALAALGNRMDAEDVCQDAFVRALERLEQCRHPERFAAWLLRIVRNRAHNYREYRRVRAGPPLEHVNASSAATGARDAERSELRGRLEWALAELSVIEREVVLLYDLDGWRHKEIAEALGLSNGMSRQHLYVARRKLREALGAGFSKEYFRDDR